MNQGKGLGLQSQCPFFSKDAWDCSPRPFLGHFHQKRKKRDGANLQHLFFAIFYYESGEKTPKMAKFAAANEPTAIYIYIYIYTYIHTYIYIYIYIYTGCCVGLWSKRPGCLGLGTNFRKRKGQLQKNAYLYRVFGSFWWKLWFIISYKAAMLIVF